MARLNLVLINQPYEVQVFVRYKLTDGSFDTMVAVVDTGADTCLFPLRWLEVAEHTILDKEVVLEQAGIAKQSFEAVEAEIILYCEDSQGNESAPMKVRAWFAETTKVILGFRDVLDRAKLYIDYQESRTGWIDL
jgi:hypothetical protein